MQQVGFGWPVQRFHVPQPVQPPEKSNYFMSLRLLGLGMRVRMSAQVGGKHPRPRVSLLIKPYRQAKLHLFRGLMSGSAVCIWLPPVINVPTPQPKP